MTSGRIHRHSHSADQARRELKKYARIHLYLFKPFLPQRPIAQGNPAQWNKKAALLTIAGEQRKAAGSALPAVSAGGAVLFIPLRGAALKKAPIQKPAIRAAGNRTNQFPAPGRTKTGIPHKMEQRAVYPINFNRYKVFIYV